MDDHRWGFEDADDLEFAEERSADMPAAEAPDTVSGSDPDSTVTVTLDLQADVVSVKLAADWRRSVDPRGLPNSVLSANQVATARALAQQIQQIPDLTVTAPLVTTASFRDTTPLAKEDVLHLVDAATADIEQFMNQLSSVVDRVVSAESSGGHVSGSARNGQILDLTIDPQWADTARNPELEGEITDLLRRLRRASTPDDLACGPQSSAISELNALVSNPDAFLRRLGLLS